MCVTINLYSVDKNCDQFIIVLLISAVVKRATAFVNFILVDKLFCRSIFFQQYTILS